MRDTAFPSGASRIPRKILFLLSLLISQATVLSGQVTSSEYAVYSTVLDHVFEHAWSDSVPVVPYTFGRLPSTAGDLIEAGMRVRPELDPDLIAAYMAANASSALLSAAEFTSVTPARLAAAEEVDYVALSRVGFSSSGDRALVHVFAGCGIRCGSGAAVVLRLQSGEWVVDGLFVTLE